MVRGKERARKADRASAAVLLATAVAICTASAVPLWSSVASVVVLASALSAAPPAASALLAVGGGEGVLRDVVVDALGLSLGGAAGGEAEELEEEGAVGELQLLQIFKRVHVAPDPNDRRALTAEGGHQSLGRSDHHLLVADCGCRRRARDVSDCVSGRQTREEKSAITSGNPWLLP